MSANKTYRCWHKDGTARLVSSDSHRNAAAEAQELAGLANAPAPPVTDVVEMKRFLNSCEVVRTECITPGDDTIRRWKT